MNTIILFAARHFFKIIKYRKACILQYTFIIYLLLLLILGPGISNVFGQDLVRGKITNDAGETIPGVNIIEKGSTNGTISDLDGNYSLETDPNGILVFSYVGYFPEEEYIEFRSIIDVRLKPEVKTLKEMVVVGYGVQAREDVTGAIYKMDNNEFNPGIINSPDELIQGKIPGVGVAKVSGEPGSESFIRIRGANTLRAGNSPLIVVDGYPMDIVNLDPPGYYDNKVLNLAGEGDPRINNLAYSPLIFLNPGDIESIDVLKDASATAIYGSRGANGVIMITTKKGSHDKINLSYNSYVSISRVREKIRVLTGDEFRMGQQEFGSEDNIYSDTISTDWQDEVFQDAITHYHDLSFSGGSRQTSYRASISYSDQKGTIRTSELQRFTGRINVHHGSFNNRLILGYQLAYGHIEHRQTSGEAAQMALYTNPTWPVYDSTGNYFYPGPEQFWDYNIMNPVAKLELNSNKVTTDKILTNMNAGFELIEGLVARINIGGEKAIANRKINKNSRLDILRTGTIGEKDASSWLFEGFLDFNKGFRDHSIGLLGGYSFQNFNVSGNEYTMKGFESDEVPFTNIMEAGNKLDLGSPSSFSENNKLQSLFARFNYTFRNKYLVTINYRLDGSSRFGKNNQYGNFPSFALGWNVAEESFLENSTVLNVLKLRGSWGITGNQEIPNKITQFSLGLGPNPFNNRAILNNAGVYTQGYGYDRTPNPDLSWEETMQWNVGMDFSLWKNRLSGTFDYYDKKTTNLIYNKAVSNAPTNYAWDNLDGVLTNQGFEGLLSILIINKKNFNWLSSITFSSFNYAVDDLTSFIPVGSNWTNSNFGPPQRISNEDEIGTFYGKVFLGFDEDGYNVFQYDSDSVIVREAIGRALPSFLYGFNNTFNLGNFDLNIFINASQSNDVYNATFNNAILKSNFLSGRNITPELLENEEAFDNPPAYSSRYIEEGTFIRLGNVTLGYNFNVTQIKWLELLRIYITGTNLYVWTNYTGFDPEANILNYNFNGIPPLGIDDRAYPRPRTLLFGLNVSF
jgi:iron complex outermembrane receptor protein